MVTSVRFLPRTHPTVVSDAKPKWYAAYTCSRHEKKVNEQLGTRNIESYLPSFTARNRWKDRYVQLQLPLFPGYVFVRLLLSERLRVLEIPGVVRLVSFGGTPVPLPDEQIVSLQHLLSNKLPFEPYPYLHAGVRVRIRSGALQGLEGIIVREKRRTRFIVSVDLVMRSIAAEVQGIDLEPLAPNIRWEDRVLAAA